MGTYGARCVCPRVGEGVWEDELPCMPSGHVEIATVSFRAAPRFGGPLAAFLSFSPRSVSHKRRFADRLPELRGHGPRARCLSGGRSYYTFGFWGPTGISCLYDPGAEVRASQLLIF